MRICCSGEQTIPRTQAFYNIMLFILSGTPYLLVKHKLLKNMEKRSGGSAADVYVGTDTT